MKNNPLLDTNFLRQLDKENQKEIFAKIISLNLDEEPIEQIEGRVTGGSINIDGSSSVRRSCSLSLIAENVNINDFYWGLSNKFKLFIGIKNLINKDYEDIIWFPQGIFLITSFNTKYATNAYNISISGKDKMCQLNGDIGGHFPNPIDFSIDTFINEDGSIVKQKKLIKDIVKEMIHYYGNEPFHNIIINDVDDKGLELLEYRGKNDLYILVDENNEYVNILFDGEVTRYDAQNLPHTISDLEPYEFYSLTPGANNISAIRLKETPSILDRTYYRIAKCGFGESFGYRMTDLTWPDKEGLIANVGDTITSILDKICNVFGDYEYFYDIDGRFIFQKKLTYLNTSWNNIIPTTNLTVADLIADYGLIKFDDWYEIDEVQYLTEAGKAKVAQYEEQTHIESSKLISQYSYSFSDSILISSFQNTPNFQTIKNDYSIWGKRPAISANSEGADIHLRYAIHEKPTQYVNFEGRTFATIDTVALNFEKEQLPEGLDDDWWDLRNWAELYKSYYGDYPEGNMDQYCKNEGQLLDLNTMFGILEPDEYELFEEVYGWTMTQPHKYYGMWVEDYASPHNGVSVFDLMPSGHLGYEGHGNGCSHPYNWFLEKYEKCPGYKAYIYCPILPQDQFNGMNVDWREIIYRMAEDYFKYNHEDDFTARLAANNPEYPYGKTGYEQYYTDMLAYWRDIYNPETEKYTLIDKVTQNMLNKGSYYYYDEEKKVYRLTKEFVEDRVYYTRDQGDERYYRFIDNVAADKLFWRKDYIQDPSLLNFWIDFLDSKGTGLSKYSVKAIGDRTKVVNDSTIKAIVYSEVPTLIYISREKYEQLKAQKQLITGYSYIIIPDSYQEFFTVSSQRKTTYTELDNLLYNYAYCNETVQINTIPIYYLEPNTKISIDDNESNIHGEYIINKISLSLKHDGIMSISASRAPIRLN